MAVSDRVVQAVSTLVNSATKDAPEDEAGLWGRQNSP
jgi:hypothetical protein